MTNSQNKCHGGNENLAQEKRTLNFWFKDNFTVQMNKIKNAYEFFLELVNPANFPKGKTVESEYLLGILIFNFRFQ